MMEKVKKSSSRFIIDPVRPGNDLSLYDAMYEHRKEVWANKAAKDFLISQNNQTQFTLKEIEKWFEV